jgi:hypothetical protein
LTGSASAVRSPQPWSDPLPPKLLGIYEAPLLEYGRARFCELRGEVVFVGMSAAPTLPGPA